MFGLFNKAKETAAPEAPARAIDPLEPLEADLAAVTGLERSQVSEFIDDAFPADRRRLLERLAAAGIADAEVRP